MIGKIERLPLRSVWADEARDFTQWLEENLEVLNEVLDLNLASAEREQSAGSFNVDLVAEDDTGSAVVIENQLERSNHDHLGKLITYTVAVGAKTAIWIVSDPRPEHVNAITWLNESSSAEFYLLKLEAIRIGSSEAAPLLTVIVGPSEESRDVGQAKKEMAERYEIRKRFWTALLDTARERTRLHASVSPSTGGSVSTGAGRSGLGLNYAVRQNEAQVELYIDRGKERDEENKEIFDQLHARRDEVEQAFGGPLQWQRLDGRRACRVRNVLKGGSRDDDWQKIHEQLVDARVRLDAALKPLIAKLDI